MVFADISYNASDYSDGGYREGGYNDVRIDTGRKEAHPLLCRPFDGHDSSGSTRNCVYE